MSDERDKWALIAVVVLFGTIALAAFGGMYLEGRERQQTIRACIAAGRPTAECEKLR